MNSEIYDALLSAGADEDKARRAAESVAKYEDRFARIESRLDVLTWMASFLLVMVAGVLWKVYR